jgi:drug/metabolite transporter (DMT)-like permease
MLVGLALALVGAFATSVAFLLEHRGAVQAPAVRVAHPLRSAAGLFRSRWFAIGWGVAVLAWGVHVGALALAPLSVVQAVYAGGLVFLAVLAERFFGFHLGRRQWVGVIITAAGLAVIGITSGPDGGETGRHALAALISVEAGAFVFAVGLVVASRTHPRLRAREGLLLGVAAGALFGVASVAVKYLTDALEGGMLELVSPWTGAAAVAGVIAFYTSARALQIGPGVEVIAITSVAANLVAIVGGVLVFRETIGGDALAITGRVGAFCLVIAGAALMPAPVRAMGGRSPGPRGQGVPDSPGLSGGP